MPTKQKLFGPNPLSNILSPTVTDTSQQQVCEKSRQDIARMDGGGAM